MTVSIARSCCVGSCCSTTCFLEDIKVKRLATLISQTPSIGRGAKHPLLVLLLQTKAVNALFSYGRTKCSWRNLCWLEMLAAELAMVAVNASVSDVLIRKDTSQCGTQDTLRILRVKTLNATSGVLACISISRYKSPVRRCLLNLLPAYALTYADEFSSSTPCSTALGSLTLFCSGSKGSPVKLSGQSPHVLVPAESYFSKPPTSILLKNVLELPPGRCSMS